MSDEPKCWHKNIVDCICQDCGARAAIKLPDMVGGVCGMLKKLSARNCFARCGKRPDHAGEPHCDSLLNVEWEEWQSDYQPSSAASKPMSVREWQGIETAPQDGTHILVINMRQP